MREESSLKRQDVVAKRDSWVRTKEQTGRDIKEPAHAAGNWNRPSFKHIWGGGRTVKTGEIREGIQASAWALPDHAAFRQKAWAVQSYQAAVRKGYRQQEKYPYHLKGHSCWASEDCGISQGAGRRNKGPGRPAVACL
ncbi:hypothetical protein LC724_16370 [Blautia sp. RD014234]|nr:hypothetical protein [Blautia parvula]